MRWVVTLLALTGVVSMQSACNGGIRCPGDREPLGDRCVCPPGTVAGEGDVCDSLPGTERDPGGASGDGGGLSRDDGGTTRPGSTAEPGAADAGVTQPPKALDPSMEPDAGTPPPGQPPPATPPGMTPPATPPAMTPPADAPREAPDCGNGVREGTEECDDGNASIFDQCALCKRPLCGDRVVNGDEECEVGVGFWSEANCSQYCRRTIYRVCRTDADCERIGDPAKCWWYGYCAPRICRGRPCGPDEEACPYFPGSLVPLNTSSHCLLWCAENWPCPPELRCSLEGETYYRCVGPGVPGFDTGLTREQTQSW